MANKIAAGEVVQRPSSALKEMLENSIDSGSDEIKVIIKNAGKTLIQVIDNGSGMSNTDVLKCIERHATSKIRCSDDLFNIKSMGFRGEAMASIAAISQMEIISKTHDDELGTKLIVEGGEIKKTEEEATSNGTSIKVKNLFYNVPARRNFLKSDAIEMRHLQEEFYRIALANPNIKMQFFNHDVEKLHLQKNNFRKRIVEIFGKNKNELLVPVNESTSLVSINGYIGKPESSKKVRGEQYFFVNSRFIKSYFLNNAIKKAYEEIIPDNYFPSYFINLKVNPKKIDINIHPTKTEIKFEDEKEIYSILRSCVKKSLGIHNITPSIDFNQELSLDLNFFNSSNKDITEPKIKVDKNYNPFDTSAVNSKTNNLIENSINDQTELLKFDIENKNDIFFQINQQYIVCSNLKEILLIHQRRAHKRILFEYFKKCKQKNSNPSQKLLFPKDIELNNINMEIINEIKDFLEKVGFEFQLKKHKMKIISIPPECQEENLTYVIENLINQSRENVDLKMNQTEKLSKNLATSLAISNIKKLNMDEMISLKNELFKCEVATHCPSGKKILINLNTKDLEKYF